MVVELDVSDWHVFDYYFLHCLEGDCLSLVLEVELLEGQEEGDQDVVEL